MEQKADKNWTNSTSPPHPKVSVFSHLNLLHHVKITALKINSANAEYPDKLMAHLPGQRNDCEAGWGRMLLEATQNTPK